MLTHCETSRVNKRNTFVVHELPEWIACMLVFKNYAAFLGGGCRPVVMCFGIILMIVPHMLAAEDVEGNETKCKHAIALTDRHNEIQPSDLLERQRFSDTLIDWPPEGCIEEKVIYRASDSHDSTIIQLYNAADLGDVELQWLQNNIPEVCFGTIQTIEPLDLQTEATKGAGDSYSGYLFWDYDENVRIRDYSYVQRQNVNNSPWNTSYVATDSLLEVYLAGNGSVTCGFLWTDNTTYVKDDTIGVPSYPYSWSDFHTYQHPCWNLYGNVAGENSGGTSIRMWDRSGDPWFHGIYQRIDYSRYTAPSPNPYDMGNSNSKIGLMANNTVNQAVGQFDVRGGDLIRAYFYGDIGAYRDPYWYVYPAEYYAMADLVSVRNVDPDVNGIWPFYFTGTGYTVPHRGSLSWYNDINGGWTSHRAGFYISAWFYPSPDNDGDDLTQYEESNGIRGWSSGVMRLSSDSDTDTDGDTIGDYDEVFGFEYYDKRQGLNVHMDDTNPSEADSSYGRALLGNATYYKKRFRNGDISYSDVDEDYDQAAMDAAVANFEGVVTFGPSGGDYDDARAGLCDAAYETSTYYMVKGNDVLAQQAFRSRLTGETLAQEIGHFETSEGFFEDAVNSYLGDDGFLTQYPQVFIDLAPTREDWDPGEGIDPFEPYRDYEQLAYASARKVETAVNAAKRQFRLSAAEPREESPMRDEVRKTVTAASVAAHLESVVLGHVLPSEGEYRPDNVGNYIGLLGGLRDSSNLLVAANSDNLMPSSGLGASGNRRGFHAKDFVPFVFFPTSDPGNNNNYHELHNVATGWVEHAKTMEQAAEAWTRDWERDQAQLSLRLIDIRSEYDTRIATIDADLADAQLEIDQRILDVMAARNQLENLYEDIVIEEERVALRAGIRYSRGENIASIIHRSGRRQAAANFAGGILGTISNLSGALFGAANSGSKSKLRIDPQKNIAQPRFIGAAILAVTAIAGVANAAISAANARAQAMDQAEIQMERVHLANELELVDSKAYIKRKLLEVANLEIQILQSVLGLQQIAVRARGIADLRELTIAARARTESAAVNALANPAFRLIRDQAIVDADKAFEDAVEEVYRTARALEYQKGEPYVENLATCNTEQSTSDIFLARRATGLEYILLDMDRDWNDFIGGCTKPAGSLRVFEIPYSVKEDFLGIKWPAVDAETGDIVDPATQWSTLLARLSSEDPNGWIRLPISTSVAEDGHFLRDIFNQRFQYFKVRIVGDIFGGLGDETAFVIIRHGETQFNRSRYSSPSTLPNGEDIINQFYMRPWQTTIQARVASYPELPAHSSWSLYNRSVGCADWELIFQPGLSFNSDIDIAAIEDFEITICWMGYDLQEE